MIILIIFPLLVMLVINYIISSKMQEIAVSKGHQGSTAFHMCFWLGVVGYFYVVALPDLVQQNNQKTIISLLSTSEDKNSESTANLQLGTSTVEAQRETINRYICKKLVVTEQYSHGKCFMCRHSNSSLRFCQITNDIGTRNVFVCSDCIQRFKDNCTEKE